ncbi:tubulin glycylase 3A-like [Prorops nasuta]|uniref:tubulin glycylase 3A-like n=1 Tax=Prorops nasuta TaxID=863751 RepID=UPI0034CE29C1
MDTLYRVKNCIAENYMNAQDEVATNVLQSPKDDADVEKKTEQKENREKQESGGIPEVVETSLKAEPSVEVPSVSEDGEKNPEVDLEKLEAELPPTLQERFLRIKELVKEAISAHKTFMIYGRSRVIRDCLLKRGWIEKYFRKPSPADQHLTLDTNPVTLLAGIGDLTDLQSERQLISRFLTNHTVDFLWNTGSDWPGWPAQDNKTTLFNRYCRASFTSKIGLCVNLRQMHWHYEQNISNTLFPRCYNLCQPDQLHAFMEDYRFTACLGLLKWLVDKTNSEGEEAARSQTGTVPVKALDFAIKRCSDFIGQQVHEDIDQEAERIWSYQWDQFLGWYYKIIQGQSVFVHNNVPFHKYFLASRHILKKMKSYWPQLDMDGIMNVWILKPGNKSRGRGIVMMNRLEDVLAKISPTNKAQDLRYVVQKYIERPLLIYNTKFDIRQWFIVTCAQPLTLWMYRESYLRFCSQKFTLGNFHESIHLCNHAIQYKYKNSADRDPALPEDNMWDSTTFKEFLKKQGHDDVWDEMIYPGMKQGLVGSLLASQEAMDRRKCSFELYGADFMVMDDFSVWLIEINSHPDMSYSSSVTTRLCKQVMEDTVKVIVDYRDDKTANTGLFELVYKQKMPTCQPYLGAALCIQGTRIATGERRSMTNLQDPRASLLSKSPTAIITKKKPMNQAHIGPMIVDLLEEIELQLDKAYYEYFETASSKFRQALPATAPAKSSKISTLLEKPTMLTKGTSAIQLNSKNPPPADQVNSGGIFKKLTKGSVKPTQKILKKPRTSTVRPVVKPQQVSPSKQQPIISKIMAFQQQSTSVTSKSSKMAKQNEDKIINTAIREAAKKYKRTATIQPQVQVSSVPLLPASQGKLYRPIPEKNKTRSYPKKQTFQKKTKVLAEIPDIYAIGLGLS